MSELTTVRWEVFARNVAGKTHREAALLTGYPEHSASCIGAQLVKLPRIADRIHELREQEFKVKRPIITREIL
jgi:phage terminase small subunit